MHAKENLAESSKNIALLRLEEQNLIEKINSLRNSKQIAAFSDKEVNEIMHKNIEEDVSQYIDYINTKLEKNINKGNLVFQISFENLTGSRKLAVEFIAKKLKEENISLSLQSPVFESTGHMLVG